MPTYEFKREDGEVIEQQHSILDIPDEIKCEDGEMAKRIISLGAGWILKGPGDDWPSQQEKRKHQGWKKSEKTNKKMYKEWNGSQPKLIDTR